VTSPNKAGAALVTGAGKRIGRAIALSLADAGYDIAVHYNSSKKEADEVVSLITDKGRKAVTLQADLSQEKETATLIGNANDTLGALILLVNSASMFEHDDIVTMTRTSWDKHIETNLRAPLKLSQDFAKQAAPDADNLIVNIIDQRVLKLTPQFLSYTTSKSALFTLTKTLAQALASRRVRVNAIGPGPTLKNPRQSNADWERQNKATILGHGATPADICGALLYLTAAPAVTGQMIVVDGGQHLAWQTPDVLVSE
jgi:NAD(P)-dependent dehydrogenase (short-subunit alcohol dehydrogenase family)